VPHSQTKIEAASIKKHYQMVFNHCASYAPVGITDAAVQPTTACTANLHSTTATERVAHSSATTIF